MKKLAILCHTSLKLDARIIREVDSYCQKYEVHIFNPIVTKEDEVLFKEKVVLHRFEIRSNWLNKNFLFSKQYQDILNLVNAFDYDIIICDNYPLLEVGVKLKKINPKIILIYDSRELWIETINQFFPTKGFRSSYGLSLIFVNKIFHSRKENSLVRKADYCITVCESIAKILSIKWKRKVYVVRNLLKIEHVISSLNKRTSIELKKNDSDVILMYQGNINPGRGLEFLLDVMSHLPNKFKCYILGNGMLKKKLLKIKNDKQIDNVIFLDAVPYEELLSLTKQIDLGISLIEPINESKRLSLPNKLFEYISVGKPFISNDLPEARLLVEKYNCGFLVDITESKKVASKIQTIGHNELSQLGFNGETAFYKELNWDFEFFNFLTEVDL